MPMHNVAPRIALWPPAALIGTMCLPVIIVTSWFKRIRDTAPPPRPHRVPNASPPRPHRVPTASPPRPHRVPIASPSRPTAVAYATGRWVLLLGNARLTLLLPGARSVTVASPGAVGESSVVMSL